MMSDAAAQSTPAKKPGSTGSLREQMWRYRHFYLFISPFFFLFAVFGLYPLLFSLYLSLVQWDGLTSPKWVGLQNFTTLLRDEQFYRAIWNTILIGVYHFPPMFILAFVFAVILNQQWVKLRAFWRAAVFMPAITPMVVIAFVFFILFSTETGLVNYLYTGALGLLGIEAAGVPWLQNGTWAKITVSILLVWRWTGYNMVIMLAGMQGIPGDMYEAATIDGASRWQQMRYLTIPMMKPTFIFITIMSLIGTVYMFDEVFVLTNGGPGDATTNFGLFLFQQSFQDFRFGYASAAAYSVALVVFVMSLVIFRVGKKGE